MHFGKFLEIQIHTLESSTQTERKITIIRLHNYNKSGFFLFPLKINSCFLLIAGRLSALHETQSQPFLSNAKLQHNKILVSAIISVLSNFDMYANVAMGKHLTRNWIATWCWREKLNRNANCTFPHNVVAFIPSRCIIQPFNRTLKFSSCRKQQRKLKLGQKTKTTLFDVVNNGRNTCLKGPAEGNCWSSFI